MMKKKVLRRNNSFWTGFAAALAAGAVATGVMIVLSVSLGGGSLPEVFGSRLTALMPPPLFKYLHQTIGGDSKRYYFYGIVVAQFIMFAVRGANYNRPPH